MRHSYYLFQAQQEIKFCSQCPMSDVGVLDRWCNLTKREISWDGATPRPKWCPLIKIEGKVEMEDATGRPEERGFRGG